MSATTNLGSTARIANGTRQNMARGCLLGALVGDSVGSLLEFIHRIPTQQDVQRALLMPGGGIWAVAPGQVTDDGELTLALARALVDLKTFDAQFVARNYVRWFHSEPFDIGNTTHAALSNLVEDEHGSLPKLLSNALRHSLASKANGSLMRQSALGIWATRLSVADAINAVRLDTQMTHPNLSCQWAGIAYVLAIRHLVLNPGRNREAFSVAFDAVRDHPGEGAVQVSGWLGDARRGKLPACQPQDGYVAIAFTHAFYHLYQATPYTEALCAMLAGGGDTDTNACIVGGLMGALHGASAIPQPMVAKLLNCDVSLGRVRPTWLQTRDAMELADGLVLGVE